ncbi:MAG: hypothetical protein ACE5GH_06370 [Fidelibacterota bacterium]
MPRLTVWFIRASLVYLLVGFSFGAMMLIYKVRPLYPFMWWVRPSHVEFLLLGWTVQLVMGVAFWILPRFEGGTGRGSVWMVWGAFALLNAGVILASLASLLNLPVWIHLTGRILEFGAVVAFASHAVPRVKPFGHILPGKD